MSALPVRLPERVVTPRLTLRRWHHDEARMLSDAISTSLDHLRPFMAWIAAEPKTLAERVDLIEGWTRSWEDGLDAVYGVFLDGEAIGGCGLHRRLGPHALEIGYWIHPDHIRQGHATELTSALTTAAFGVDGVDRVEVHTDEANAASAAIPSRLGFIRQRIEERDATAPSESGRFIIWTMSIDAWRTPPEASEASASP